MFRERQEEWIYVKDKLPLEEYRDDCISIIGDFLVTVEHDDHETWEDREVMILTFYLKECKWKTPDGKDYNWGWNVVAWMDKPEPASDEEKLCKN